MELSEHLDCEDQSGGGAAQSFNPALKAVANRTFGLHRIETQLTIQHVTQQLVAKIVRPGFAHGEAVGEGQCSSLRARESCGSHMFLVCGLLEAR